MLEGESVELVKTGFTFLNHIIEFCADLYMDEDSV